MKITPEHYQKLKTELEPHIVPAMATRYQVEGLSPKRFRWDCAYRAKLSGWICDNLYSYMDDTHIDTALRSVMKERGLNWAAGDSQ